MKEAFKRGRQGEYQVALILNRLDRHFYKILNNVTIRNEANNRTSQIDHIVVSIYGVFVIETKNYKGTIVGDEYSKSWVTLTDSGERDLYSPTVQNWGHVKALKSILWEWEDRLPITSVVCFMDTAELLVDAKIHQVVKASNLEELFLKYKYKLLLLGAVDEIVKLIKDRSIEFSEYDHSKAIKDAMDAANERENHLIE